MSGGEPDRDFWRRRYREGHTPWDLGGVSPAARELVRRWFPPVARVFVPGCGHGYEALYLAARGHAVTALDLAPEPLEHLRAEARARGVSLTIREGDLLRMPPTDDGTFDVLLEQTCLCALPPRLHGDYERMAHRILRPGGQLLGVLMRVPFDHGPPYDLAPEAVWELFPEGRWSREGPWPAAPNPARPGPEYLVRLVRLG